NRQRFHFPIPVLALSAPGLCHLRFASVPSLAFILEPRQCCKSFLKVPFHKFTFKSSTKFVIPTDCSSIQGFKLSFCHCCFGILFRFFLFLRALCFLTEKFSGLFCLYITYFVSNSSQ